MVKLAIAAAFAATLVAGAPSARAEEELDLVPKLGFRINYGALPLALREAKTTTVGLGVEHPTFGKVRMFGEYEWMWFSEWDKRKSQSMNLPALHGSGQRAQLGLRRALAFTAISRDLRMFVDGEIGGGAMLASEDWTGTTAVPHGLVGLRLGYDFRNGQSSSRIFEAEIMLRMIVVPTGYGLVFGVGMLWGD